MAEINLHSSIWKFTTNLYDVVRSCVAWHENIILSPFSIHLALTLSLMGAAGKTASEIACGLAMADYDLAVIIEAYQKLIASMDKQLTLANKLFVMTGGGSLSMPFQNLVSNEFKSEIQEINFADSSGAADIINNWIDAKTNHRIHNCVAPTELNNRTRLVLVNTIHFKCMWANKFPGTATKKQPFFHSDTKSTKVDMMWQTAYFPFCEIKSLDCDAIRLRYDDSQLAMVILLPKSRTGLDALNANLKNSSSFPEIFKQIRSKQNVSLSLPKFNATLEIKLKEVLLKMGMRSMFDPKMADFSKMLQNDADLFVNSVVHNAYIDVNEDGTEAGATTAIQYEFLSADDPPEPVPFNADHPFRYFIIDSENLVLFDGCLRNTFGMK